MTDVQVLTLALAVIVPLSLLIYSNSRITEAKETLRAEMALGFERTTNSINALRGEIDTLSGEIDTLREEISTLHGDVRLLTGKTVEVDNRLLRIEDRIGPAR
jgi:predicted  nucleic acid-binding Zn-ribbon protein